jgi:hypothetical protein
MAVPDSFARAYLMVEGGDKLECWFNPENYSVTKTSTWESESTPGQPMPTPQYTGGQPRSLTVELLFDDTEKADGDVSGVIAKLFTLLEVPAQGGAANKNSGRPPTVEFGWGTATTFKAVVTSLTATYTLFRPNGTPVRATAKLGLMQAEDDPGTGARWKPRQNPTTSGIGGIRSHTVRDGDSLQSIAFREYGDPTRWRVIAEANDVDDPVRLRRGSVLTVPRLES